MLGFAEKLQVDQETALLYSNVQALRENRAYTPTCDKSCMLYYGCMAATAVYEQSRMCQGIPLLGLDDPIRYLFEILDGTYYQENLPKEKNIGQKFAKLFR